MTFRRFRTDQAGFSLVELLMAMALGSIVLTALMTVFIRGAGGAMKSSDRVEALARGRLAMDRVVTLLNSQSCLLNADGTSQPPILDGQATQVTFYASLGKVDSDTTIYRLRYDAASKRLWEDQFPPVRSGGNVTFPSYPASPAVSRTIGTNILPVASTPIFQYWQFITTEGPTLGMINPTRLGTPLDAAGRLSAVRLTMSFVAQPQYSKNSTADLHATTLEGIATVGSANAGEPTKGVNC